MRSEGKLLYFNTRIVRVTELFLFVANLYEVLGLSPETRLQVRVKHKGLRGEYLLVLRQTATSQTGQ